MAYAPTHFAPRETAFTKNSAPPAAQTKRNVFWRFYDAIMQSRQRQADAEIARYIQTHGAKITDETEREIERRFLR